MEKQENPLLSLPLLEWLDDPNEAVVGRRLSTACYVEDSISAVIYLAFKYHADFGRALSVNTNLAGDNVHRGAVLGALHGAANGTESIPERWVSGLFQPPPDLFSENAA